MAVNLTMSMSEAMLLTAKEVAEILRVAPSTIYGAAARGDIPCVRPWHGRRKSLLRFRRRDIEALIQTTDPAQTARTRGR